MHYFKGVSLYGDAVIFIARRAIYHHSLPGVFAVLTPARRSNSGFSCGWINYGYNKRAFRSHGLLCLYLALYRQRASLAVASPLICNANSDFWRRGIPA